LPGIIFDRVFDVFDRNENDYLDFGEFYGGMMTLFVGDYSDLTRLIFELYDFNKDNFICPDEIRLVLSYIPINNERIKNARLKFEKYFSPYFRYNYLDRVESQVELHELLEKSFVGVDKLDYDAFIFVTEHICSEIFLYLLIFLLEKQPFSKISLKRYGSTLNLKGYLTPEQMSSKKIISPNLHSKFSPSISLSKSPYIRKKYGIVKSTTIMNPDSKNILLQYTCKQGESNALLQSPLKMNKQKKSMTALKLTRHIEEDLTFSKNKAKSKEFSAEVSTLKTLSSEDKRYIFSKASFNTSSKFNFVSTVENDTDEDDERVEHQGYLFKIKRGKLIRIWVKLIHKDMYIYTSDSDSDHKKLLNLSGVYIQEEKSTHYDREVYYKFSIISTSKIRVFTTNKQEDYQQWLSCFKKITGPTNVELNYEFIKDLSEGKFATVRLAKHKDTGRQVAIKIIDKAEMSKTDIALIKSEIEILKIAQHPNLIQLYDIIENKSKIHISKLTLTLVMEYCEGGDFFTYLEKRNYKLPESRVATIIHKLATAVFYLHSYGVTHRDIKPENILMTDKTDNSDIKLLDFGLSKIIGPQDKCIEPYGTIVKLIII
jgi:Ca2+-binding EF-hand superfamily protein/glucan-binding YG repeat protein